LTDLEGHKSRASHVCWSHFCATRGLEKAAPAGARATRPNGGLRRASHVW
jgi:hypothetical protein